MQNQIVTEERELLESQSIEEGLLPGVPKTPLNLISEEKNSLQESLSGRKVSKVKPTTSSARNGPSADSRR